MFGLLAFAALMVANGFFVAYEFGLVAVDRNRIDQLVEEGNRAAGGVQRLLKRLSFHLSTAQLGITVMSLLLGFVAEPAIARFVEPVAESVLPEGVAGGISIAIALTLATLVHMVLGEQVPKYIAIARPERITVLLTRPVVLWGVLVSPLVRMLNGIADATVRALGVEPVEERESNPDLAELQHMIASSGDEGTLDPEEVDLLTRSIRFSEKDAAEALVPRVEVEALELDQTVEELVNASLQTGFSRFPIVGEDLDDVHGVVHVKSVYGLPIDERATTPVSAIMTEVLAVPESRELEDLFDDLRTNRDHLAIVVDEHGGTAGIITLEDLLEEIVGEIDDEYDSTGAETTRVEQFGSYVVSAALHADEVADATGFTMPEGDYETIAGFVLDQLGHIPEPGEIVQFEGWRIEVVAMNRLRIATVRVVAPPGQPVPEEPGR